MAELKIDKEFQDLIPLLTVEENKLLEESVRAEGCRDPIVVWKKGKSQIIVDGHHRYEICKEHGIDFKTVVKNFKTREECMIWMIQNQRGRRNLTVGQRAMLGEKLVTLNKGQKKKKADSSKELSSKTKNTEDSSKELSDVAQADAAKAVDVSVTSIKRARKVRTRGSDELVKSVEKGDVSLGRAAAVVELPKDEQVKAATVPVEKSEPPPPPKAERQPVPQPVLDVVAKLYNGAEIDPLDPLQMHDAGAWAYPVMEEIDKYWKLIKDAWLNGDIDQCIVLVDNRTNEKWFQELTILVDYGCFPEGVRGKFIGYTGDNWEQFCEEFSKFGFVCGIMSVD